MENPTQLLRGWSPQKGNPVEKKKLKKEDKGILKVSRGNILEDSLK
ncbi:hypothetical protein An16g02050 [Aspergillus niger]|uniref:Uncharacterized protein n=2 Tax=Aspergillus niger TaxID=5061 RepID=A2R726_ASPNC|nr:hypothetical protein An16g02050 [Aspergillus niger]CAL00429.1 hypothetical protein An16g02050 [Aspergillus niger]